MNNSILIRPLIAGDALAYRSIRLFALQDSPASFSQSYEVFATETMEDIQTRIESGEDNKIFGAFAGDELIGMAGVYRTPWLKGQHRAEIWGVFVHPDYRGRKVGAGLLDAAIAFAATRGIMQLELGVATTNYNAIALYRSRDFHTVGTIPNFMQVDGIFYDEFTMVHLLPLG